VKNGQSAHGLSSEVLDIAQEIAPHVGFFRQLSMMNGTREAFDFRCREGIEYPDGRLSQIVRYGARKCEVLFTILPGTSDRTQKQLADEIALQQIARMKYEKQQALTSTPRRLACFISVLTQ